MTIQTNADLLLALKIGAWIAFGEDDGAYVTGVMSFESQEKPDDGSAWRARGDGTYRIIQLGDGRVLVYFPEKEAGARKWFLMEQKEADNVSNAIKEHAQDFGRKGQGKRGQTHFEWDGEPYRMLDIGKQTWRAEGEGFLSAGNGESRHVLAVSTKNHGRYFMVVDSVKGPGADTLLIGTMIDPEDAIASVQS